MISTNIEQAAQLLRAGQLVAFPTETVYGLGALALDAVAVARIFEAKQRPRFDPLIVHVAEASEAFGLCVQPPSRLAELLARTFWPGPLTLVLPKASCMPDIVTSGLPSVALRVPAHPIAQQLLRAVNAPVAAPSANRFGQVSPTQAAHVDADLGAAVTVILDGGPCQRGVESTVLSLVDDRPTLLRPGATALEDIEAIIGPIHVSCNGGSAPQSPGQLTSHYAPRTPMQPLSLETLPKPHERVGLLAFQPRTATGFAALEVLSATGNLVEAAAALFAALRRLDSEHLDRIVCEMVPPHGVGVAINDRLARGCAR
jgi:L-threonylcarbamoyladenylate synthase